MAILSKDDLRAVFVLLALVYLFDSYLSGYLATAILVALIMVALVFYSKDPNSQKLINNLGVSNNELLIRASVVIVLIGVLLLNQYLIALGFLVAMVLLFEPMDSLNINIWGLTVMAPSKKK